MTKLYTFAFWNLENLFAPETFPERIAWLAERMADDLKGWTPELFSRKLDQLTRILQQINSGKGPDALGVCEVENRYVLEQLCQRLNSALPARRYIPVHADSSKDGRGIDTAFVVDSKRLSLVPDTLFSHFVMRRTGTRDISQATFKTKAGQEIVLLCNHWPSRSGGNYESRGYRFTAGESLAYFHQRIREVVGVDTPILAMGDFNDEPFDESLQKYAEATRERGDVERSRTAPRFYNLSWWFRPIETKDCKGKKRLIYGTIYFEGNGAIFDQLLVSQGLLLPSSGLKVREETAKVEIFPEMVDSRAGEGPIRFGLAKGNVAVNVNPNGYSDHFPVSVVIEETSAT
ncbi:MAG: endonuclease/exonuclease/phosphatase family protein [Cyanobacteriota bacterium]|nr:endonuclease/exonuclease/phosphatase family protein [Cyanobacteriota bacterium]